jgi:hypothetical protein
MVVICRESASPWANYRPGNPPERSQPALDLADIMQDRARYLGVRSVLSQLREPASNVGTVPLILVALSFPEGKFGWRQTFFDPQTILR